MNISYALKNILRIVSIAIVLVLSLFGFLTLIWFHIFTPVNPAVTLYGIDYGFFSAVRQDSQYTAVEYEGKEYRLPINEGFGKAAGDFLWHRTKQTPEGSLLLKFSDGNRVISVYSDGIATVETDQSIPGYLSKVHYKLPNGISESLLDYFTRYSISLEEWKDITRSK